MRYLGLHYGPDEPFVEQPELVVAGRKVMTALLGKETWVRFPAGSPHRKRHFALKLRQLSERMVLAVGLPHLPFALKLAPQAAYDSVHHAQ